MGTDSDFADSVEFTEVIFGVDRRKNTPDGALETFRRFLSCQASVPATLDAAVKAFRKMRVTQGAEDLTDLLTEHPKLAQTYRNAASRRRPAAKRATRGLPPLPGPVQKRTEAKAPLKTRTKRR